MYAICSSSKTRTSPNFHPYSPRLGGELEESKALSDSFRRSGRGSFVRPKRSQTTTRGIRKVFSSAARLMFQLSESQRKFNKGLGVAITHLMRFHHAPSSIHPLLNVPSGDDVRVVFGVSSRVVIELRADSKRVSYFRPSQTPFLCLGGSLNVIERLPRIQSKLLPVLWVFPFHKHWSKSSLTEVIKRRLRLIIR